MGAQRVSPPALRASRCGITAVDGQVALACSQRTRPAVAATTASASFVSKATGAVRLLHPTTERGPGAPPGGRTGKSPGRGPPRPAPPRSPPSPRDSHLAASTKRSRPSLPPSSGSPQSGGLCRDGTASPCAVTVSWALASASAFGFPAACPPRPTLLCFRLLLFCVRVLLGSAPNRIANPWTKCLHGTFQL